MEPWDSESSQKREQKAGLYLLPGGGPRAPSLRFAVAAHGSSCEWELVVVGRPSGFHSSLARFVRRRMNERHGKKDSVPPVRVPVHTNGARPTARICALPAAALPFRRTGKPQQRAAAASNDSHGTCVRAGLK